MISAIIQINSHSVRNLSSLDKRVSFSAELVDEEEFKLKFAQWIMYLPADAVIKASFEVVED